MDGKDFIKELSDNVINVRLDIRELMTEVRSLKDLRDSVVEHEARLAKLDDSVKSAHARADRIDKITFWAGTTIAAGYIGLITWIMQKGI